MFIFALPFGKRKGLRLGCKSVGLGNTGLKRKRSLTFRYRRKKR